MFQKQKGFTLIESLIALVIFAIVFLGAASLQLYAAQNNQESFNRLYALTLAEDLANRLTVNRPAVYNNTYHNFNFNCETPPPNICEPRGAQAADDCDSQKMATFDEHTIACTAPKMLQQSEVNVTCIDSDTTDAFPCTTGSFQLINIAWARPNWKDNPDYQTSLGAPECPLVTGSTTVHKPCIELRVLP